MDLVLCMWHGKMATVKRACCTHQTGYIYMEPNVKGSPDKHPNHNNQAQTNKPFN